MKLLLCSKRLGGAWIDTVARGRTRTDTDAGEASRTGFGAGLDGGGASAGREPRWTPYCKDARGGERFQNILRIFEGRISPQYEKCIT